MADKGHGNTADSRHSAYRGYTVLGLAAEYALIGLLQPLHTTLLKPYTALGLAAEYALIGILQPLHTTLLLPFVNCDLPLPQWRHIMA